MSLSSALSASLSSLSTIQQSIGVISGNVTNASVEGYSRKRVVQGPVVLGGNFGGSQIIGYTRAFDLGLYTSLNSAISEAGKNDTQNEYLQKVAQLFGTNVSNPLLASTMEKFASAWRELEATPEGNIQQNQVIQTGKEFAAEIRRLSTGIEDLDRQIRTDITSQVSDLNAALQKIQTLNIQVSAAISRGQPTGDYEDDRDRVIREIADMMQVRVFERDRGQIALYTANGFALIDGVPNQFSYDGTTITITGQTQNVSTYMTGGRMEGLVKLRLDSSPATASSDPGEELIRKLRDQLDEIAGAFLTVAAGPPATFAHAYNNATLDATASPAELDTGFFSGTGRTDIAVNANLLDGTNQIKAAAIPQMVLAFNDGTRSYTMDGLSLTNVTYSGLVTSVLSGFQQYAVQIGSRNEIADANMHFYNEKYQAEIGVNIDEEMILLQIFQTNYSATARLISVIGEMFATLDQMAR